jgi:hypothetical protein
MPLGVVAERGGRTVRDDAERLRATLARRAVLRTLVWFLLSNESCKEGVSA